MKHTRSFNLILISIILFISFNVKAKAIYLNLNEPAPFAGLLLDEYSAKQATLESKQLTEYKKLNETNQEIIKIMEYQQKDNKIINILWFIGGVLAGGMAYKSINGK